MPLHPVVAEVTQRIIERSKETRADYVRRMDAVPLLILAELAPLAGVSAAWLALLGALGVVLVARGARMLPLLVLAAGAIAGWAIGIRLHQSFALRVPEWAAALAAAVVIATISVVFLRIGVAWMMALLTSAIQALGKVAAATDVVVKKIDEASDVGGLRKAWDDVKSFAEAHPWLTGALVILGIVAVGVVAYTAYDWFFGADTVASVDGDTALRLASGG